MLESRPEKSSIHQGGQCAFRDHAQLGPPPPPQNTHREPLIKKTPTTIVVADFVLVGQNFSGASRDQRLATTFSASFCPKPPKEYWTVC